MSYRYTEKERDFIKENYEIYGAKYCAMELNRKPDSVFNQASKMGIKRKYGYDKLNISLFNNINDPKTAYFMGLFWADGTVYTYRSNKTNHYHIRLEILKQDMDDIEDVIDHIGKWSKNFRTRGKWQEVAVYTISSKPVYEKFVEFDFNNKSKVDPAKILSKISNEYHYMFWRGFFDGDGCITFNDKMRSIKFSGGFDLKWKSLQTTLSKLDIKYGLYKYNNKTDNSSSIMIQNKKGIVKFINYAFNSNIEIGFSRKRVKCLEFKEKHSL